MYALDIIFTSLPDFVNKFRSMGITTYYLAPSFDDRVLNTKKAYTERKYEISFIADDSEFDNNLLENLSMNCDLNIWGELPGRC